MDKNFSHHLANYADEDLQNKITEIKNRLEHTNSISGYSFAELAKMVDELGLFDLGRFVLMNQGIDGYWTDYAINFPREKITTLPRLEQLILNSRVFMATYQRQQIFKRENQEKIQNGNHLASIPSGLMSELLDLDYSGISEIELTAVDLDTNAFIYSEEKYPLLYKKFKINKKYQDALQLEVVNQFDLISSNGLTIYIPDDAIVAKLFNNFYMALKPGGKLVTSFLTYTTNFLEKTEQLPINDIVQHKCDLAIFVDILQAKWSCFRTTAQITNLLKSNGFTDIKVFADDNYVFPTVTAYKTGTYN